MLSQKSVCCLFFLFKLVMSVIITLIEGHGSWGVSWWKPTNIWSWRLCSESSAIVIGQFSISNLKWEIPRYRLPSLLSTAATSQHNTYFFPTRKIVKRAEYAFINKTSREQAPFHFPNGEFSIMDYRKKKSYDALE